MHPSRWNVSLVAVSSVILLWSGSWVDATLPSTRLPTGINADGFNVQEALSCGGTTDPQTVNACVLSTANGCKGGDPFNIAAYLAGNGASSEACWPYVSGGNGDLNAQFTQSSTVNLPPCSSLPTSCTTGRRTDMTSPIKGKSAVSMQEAILRGGPIAVGFTVYSDFMKTYAQPTSTNYPSGVYFKSANATVSGGHAVVLYGWGNDPTVGPYWLARNQWDVTWGLNGYFRIRRGTDECGIETSGWSAIQIGTVYQPYSDSCISKNTASSVCSFSNACSKSVTVQVGGFPSSSASCPSSNIFYSTATIPALQSQSFTSYRSDCFLFSSPVMNAQSDDGTHHQLLSSKHRVQNETSKPNRYSQQQQQPLQQQREEAQSQAAVDGHGSEHPDFILGAYSKLDVADEDVMQAAHATLILLNQLVRQQHERANENDEYEEWTLLCVLRAHRQVVRGTNYHLKLEIQRRHKQPQQQQQQQQQTHVFVQILHTLPPRPFGAAEFELKNVYPMPMGVFHKESNHQVYSSISKPDSDEEFETEHRISEHNERVMAHRAQLKLMAAQRSQTESTSMSSSTSSSSLPSSSFVVSQAPLTNIPARYDFYSAYPDCMPNVLNQGECGCCYAFAGMQAAADRACFYDAVQAGTTPVAYQADGVVVVPTGATSSTAPFLFAWYPSNLCHIAGVTGKCLAWDKLNGRWIEDRLGLRCIGLTKPTSVQTCSAPAPDVYSNCGSSQVSGGQTYARLVNSYSDCLGSSGTNCATTCARILLAMESFPDAPDGQSLLYYWAPSACCAANGYTGRCMAYNPASNSFVTDATATKCLGGWTPLGVDPCFTTPPATCTESVSVVPHDLSYSFYSASCCSTQGYLARCLAYNPVTSSWLLDSTDQHCILQSSSAASFARCTAPTADKYSNCAQLAVSSTTACTTGKLTSNELISSACATSCNQQSCQASTFPPTPPPSSFTPATTAVVPTTPSPTTVPPQANIYLTFKSTAVDSSTIISKLASCLHLVDSTALSFQSSRSASNASVVVTITITRSCAVWVNSSSSSSSTGSSTLYTPSQVASQVESLMSQSNSPLIQSMPTLLSATSVDPLASTPSPTSPSSSSDSSTSLSMVVIIMIVIGAVALIVGASIALFCCRGGSNKQVMEGGAGQQSFDNTNTRVMVGAGGAAVVASNNMNMNAMVASYSASRPQYAQQQVPQVGAAQPQMQAYQPTYLVAPSHHANQPSCSDMRNPLTSSMNSAQHYSHQRTPSPALPLPVLPPPPPYAPEFNSN